MTTTLVKEDGTLYEEHTFYVHRYAKDVDLHLRKHSDTLGRFETLASAIERLEDRKAPELMYTEKRVEYFEIECNCGSEVYIEGELTHYEDCAVIQFEMHFQDDVEE
jgi:hypothetical protein